MSLSPRCKKDIHGGVGLDLDDQIERLVDNRHIVINAKKGSKVTPICEINKRETLSR